MAALVIPNGAYMRLRWSSTGGTWANVIGLRGNPTMPTIDQALAELLHADVSAALTASGMLPILNANVIWEGIAVKDLTAPNRPEFLSTGTPLSATGTGDMLPLSAAVCVTLRTALAGKSFRGRVYLSGWDETQNTAAGRTAASANTAAKAFIDGIGARVNAHGTLIAVLSRPADAVTIPAKTYAARNGQANAVTSTLVRNTKWESQRRRTGRE